MNLPHFKTAFVRIASRQVEQYVKSRGYSVLRKEGPWKVALFDKDEPRLTVELLVDPANSMVDLSALIHTPVGPPNMVEVFGGLLGMGEMMLGPQHSNDILIVNRGELIMKRRIMVRRSKYGRLNTDLLLQMAEFESFAQKVRVALEGKVRRAFLIKRN
jgi:hypothetical protein